MKRLTTITIIFLLFLLLFFPKSALAGSKNGLLLWFNIILPTLLPFVIISNLIIQFHISEYISLIFYPILSRTFGVSKEGCYPIIIGMLSGYPVGAKACADLVKSKKITIAEGQFLLSFCNNASPMFITGYISLQCLNIPHDQYIILAIILISSVSSGFLYRLFTKRNSTNNTSIFSDQNYCTVTQASSPDNGIFFQILDNTILNSFKILTKIGGYIILLSFIAQIINDSPLFPVLIKAFIIGLLEITTGCSVLCLSNLSFQVKTVLIIMITAFGGLSGLAQTQSVISNSGLSIKKYFIFKIANAIIAGTLTIFLLRNFNLFLP